MAGDDDDDDKPMEEEEATEERVTAQSYGALDTSRVAEECWMIKIPQKLADLWDKAPEGTDLGELIFTKGGTDPATKTKTKPSLMVRVSEEFAEQQQTTIPLNYSLQAMTKKVPLMHPFVRNPKNGTVSLLGTVSRTANAQVEQQDSKYRALLKDRLVATSITSSRFVKPVEVSESVIAKQRSTAAAMGSSSSGSSTRAKRGFGDAVVQVGKRMLEATQEGLQQQQQQQMEQGRAKKARQFEPDQPIRSVVFELFGQQQYWSLKALKSAAVAGGATNAGTKKAETEIKNVLREIAEYHRSGDHKSMWELRKEFQKQT